MTVLLGKTKEFRYTPKKIDNMITSLTLAETNTIQILEKYKLLKIGFNRIKFAMISDFDKALKDRVQEEKIKIEKELKIDLAKHEEGSYYYNQISSSLKMITMKTRIRLMKGFNEELGFNPLERWAEFTFHLKTEWQKDRKMFIESGEIDPNG